MTRDVVGLLDELQVERCHLVGYSMGAFVTVSVLASDPRPASGVLCGVGENVLRPADRSSHEAIADALEAPDPRAITNRHAKGFRDFADLTGADREALAAMSRSRRDERYEVPDLKAIKTPVLVVVGDRDDLAGSPQGLADRLPDGRAEVVGGTHLNAVNNPAFHRAVVGFLREQEGRAHG
jgi:pimeloyl-ACP methyl ester carboxylesterase